MGLFNPAESNEHPAVAHLLNSRTLARKFKPDRHVDVDGNVDFPALLSDCHSSTERILALAAWQLSDGGGENEMGPELSELVIRLDDEQFEALIEAMRLRRQVPASP